MSSSLIAEPVDCRDVRPPLANELVVVAGRLLGCDHRSLARIVGEQGGQLLTDGVERATLIVISDDAPTLEIALEKCEPAVAEGLRRALSDNVATVLSESQFWRRIDVLERRGVSQLYTPSLLAELLKTPTSAVRHWTRHGALRPVRWVGRLPYYDFAEAAVGRRLAELFQAGCSLRVIDRRLAELARRAPQLERPLADASVVIRGRRVYLRRGDDLAEPNGQLLIDFDAPPREQPGAETPALLPLACGLATAADKSAGEAPADAELGRTASKHPASASELEQAAMTLEDDGRLREAAELYRAALLAGGPRPELQFALADVLYRLGDLPAARERYYAAIELEEDFLEARSSLGCVLAELGDYELAAEAFDGALQIQSDFADAHFHLANALLQLGRSDDAAEHFRVFLELAPEGPWAAIARDHLQDVVPASTS